MRRKLAVADAGTMSGSGKWFSREWLFPFLLAGADKLIADDLTTVT